MLRNLIASLAFLATFAFTGGTVLAAFTPPGITISTDDSKCGQVTVTATGYGLTIGTTYQLVADRAVKTAVASIDHVATATFTRAESGEWGNVAIRTSYGGYLAATTPLGAGLAWYHVRAC